MDKVTVTDKRSKATSPNVASAEEIPQSEFFASCSEDSSLFLESASSSDSSEISSSSFSLSPSFSDEPLNDSEMLAQLPISSKWLKENSSPYGHHASFLSFIHSFCVICKRGLYKFYKGKSRAFTCLSDVKSVEDLAKRKIPQRKSAIK